MNLTTTQDRVAARLRKHAAVPFGRLPSLAVLWRRLERERTQAAEALLWRHADLLREARRLTQALSHERTKDCERALDVIATRFLCELRGALKSEHDGASRLVSAGLRLLDTAVRTEQREYFDLDGLSARHKRLGMHLLDTVNQVAGSFASWRRALAEALAGLDQAHVHDLAAGAGGFVRYLADRPPRGLRLRLSCSDRDPTYVAMGASTRAARRGRVRFEQRDALSLADLADVDLFICTQAVHHFAPGAVVQLFAQATAHARRGFLVIDLVRSLSTLLGTGAVLPFIAPHPLLVFDGMTSIRRSYSPAELGLLARLAGITHTRVQILGPVHFAVHATSNNPPEALI